jgi:hypothetical protein
MRSTCLKSATTFLALVVATAAFMLVHVRVQANSRGKARVQAVHALFDLGTPEGGPFPSDRFTTPDPDQNTGLRVDLPLPDCASFPSDCEDLRVLNQLDGFNMQPRLSIPFDGPIDPATVTSETVFLIGLGDTFDPPGRGRRVGINQVIWDSSTNTLHARSDESLEQRTRYALVVTRGVREPSGAPVEASEAFRRFRHTVRGPYKHSLLEAIQAARRFEVREDDIAAASVFTTQSFSHIIERMREAIQATPAPTLDFGVGPGGARAVFDASQVQTLTKNLQTRTTGPLTPQAVALAQLGLIPGAVGTLAFGTFRTPDFTTRPSGHIAPIPTRTGTLAPTGTHDVSFNLWLPSGTPPDGGWPVAIYGHGSVGHKDSAFAHAAVLNSHGVAVISINAVGRGGGPLTTMTARLTDGTTMTFAAPGLGFDTNGDGTIAAWEPQRAQRPHALLNTSGSIAQAAAQYFALVRGIQAGVDVDGDGAPDLDASRIYYFGQSMGAMWGVLVFAYEPAIRAAVFNVPAGTLIYNTNFSAVNRPGLGQLLAARTPSLLNPEYGLTSIDGIAVAGPHFNENLPLRNQPPRVDTVPGAADIQRFVDRIAWAAQITNTVAFAPLLRRSPPSGVPARPFVLQFARSDQNVVNPSTTELIRAGDFADRALFYRHDLNFGLPGVPPDPHAFLSTLNPATPNVQRVALGAQHQIGTFFETEGAEVTAPTPTHLWEAPISGPLPEDTFFLPRPR